MVIAIGIDILELALAATGVGIAANYAIDIAKILIIPIWLSMKGVSPVKPGRFMRLLVMGIIGLIPIVGGLVPEVALGMWSTISHSRKEDRKGVK
jgi:hypothetical protein